MSLKISWPRSPADSMSRSPAPMIRSKNDWLEARSLTFSSGMSRVCLARIPDRKTSRSLVTTKWVVCQLMSRLPSHTAQPRATAAVAHSATVCTSPFCLSATTSSASTGRPANSGPAKNHQWGRRSRTTVSPSRMSRFGKGMGKAYARDPRPFLTCLSGGHPRTPGDGLLVPLAPEDVGRQRADPVEEQHPVQMVELVEEGPGLEGVGLDHP